MSQAKTTFSIKSSETINFSIFDQICPLKEIILFKTTYRTYLQHQKGRLYEPPGPNEKGLFPTFGEIGTPHSSFEFFRNFSRSRFVFFFSIEKNCNCVSFCQKKRSRKIARIPSGSDEAFVSGDGIKPINVCNYISSVGYFLHSIINNHVERTYSKNQAQKTEQEDQIFIKNTTKNAKFSSNQNNMFVDGCKSVDDHGNCSTTNHLPRCRRCLSPSYDDRCR